MEYSMLQLLQKASTFQRGNPAKWFNALKDLVGLVLKGLKCNLLLKGLKCNLLSSLFDFLLQEISCFTCFFLQIRIP